MALERQISRAIIAFEGEDRAKVQTLSADMMLFTLDVRREIVREALFLWITPFEAVLSIVEMVSFSTDVSSGDFEDNAASRLLIAFFMRVFRALLRRRRASLCFARLIADLWLAKSKPPRVNFGFRITDFGRRECLLAPKWKLLHYRAQSAFPLVLSPCPSSVVAVVMRQWKADA
jgi:hypothetical protein